MKEESETLIEFGFEPHLSTEEIESKAIEAADDGLLHIQAESIKGPHSGEQDSGTTSTKHVDVHCLIPLSHFHLRMSPQSINQNSYTRISYTSRMNKSREEASRG